MRDESWEPNEEYQCPQILLRVIQVFYKLRAQFF